MPWRTSWNGLREDLGTVLNDDENSKEYADDDGDIAQKSSHSLRHWP
jgi:hypothetical protein